MKVEVWECRHPCNSNMACLSNSTACQCRIRCHTANRYTSHLDEASFMLFLFALTRNIEYHLHHYCFDTYMRLFRHSQLSSALRSNLALVTHPSIIHFFCTQSRLRCLTVTVNHSNSSSSNNSTDNKHSNTLPSR